MTTARDPRREAQDVVGESLVARVLEPSPPAVVDDWFADDPLAIEDARARVVTPIPGQGATWDGWLSSRPQHEPWVSARWLGAYRRLGSPTSRFAETRRSLHRLAAYAISPARRRVNGKIGLRWTLDGFGTPFFGHDEQVRVTGVSIVRQHGRDAVAEPITSLTRAAAFVLDGTPDVAWAEPFDVPEPGDLDETLPVEAASAALLADWYGFAFSVLEALRADPESVEASRVQIWPEHFDAAFECLPDDQRRRATFGASPGDGMHPEPYLYVTPWYFDEVETGDTWNATDFRGAILGLGDLVGVEDQRDAALTFLRRCRTVLTR